MQSQTVGSYLRRCRHHCQDPYHFYLDPIMRKGLEPIAVEDDTVA